jgi:hypothetical protein
MWFLVATALAGTKIQIGEMTSNGLTVHELFCDWSDPGLSAAFAGPSMVGSIAQKKADFDACAPQGSAAKLAWSTGATEVTVEKAETPAIGACIAGVAKPIVQVTKGSCTMVVLVGEPKRATQIGDTVDDSP